MAVSPAREGGHDRLAACVELVLTDVTGRHEQHPPRLVVNEVAGPLGSCLIDVWILVICAAGVISANLRAFSLARAQMAMLM